MKKITISFAFMLLFCSSILAQGSEFIASWHIGIPSQGITNYIAKTSFQGFGFEYRYALNQQFTVGGSISWNVFSEEKDISTWTFDNLSVTSHNWRFGHMVPILVNAHFNPMRNTGNPLQIFMGGGLGTSYVNQEIWPGMYTYRHETWSFVAYPEIGLRYVMSNETALYFSTQYMFLPNANYDNNNIGYWNLKLGFSFGAHRW